MKDPSKDSSECGANRSNDRCFDFDATWKIPEKYIRIPFRDANRLSARLRIWAAIWLGIACSFS